MGSHAPQTPDRNRRFRRPRVKFDLSKAMFVLPNLFTTSSIFCGVYAIVHVSNGPSPQDFYHACVAVFFGAFFDMIDGRVARLTRTQSDFGVQLDSLADLVTFGVAPAIIVYQWALAPLELLGIAISFVYVACGAIRLARFNVLAANSTELSPHFIGLPIPLAAGTLTCVVMFHQRTMEGALTEPAGAISLLLLIACLMVSNVRYRNFKDVKKGSTPFYVLLTLAGLLVGLGAVYRPTLAIVTFFFGYVLMGLIESFIGLVRKTPEAS